MSTTDNSHDLAVTKELLSLILTIQKAAAFYRAETALSKDFDTPSPANYLARCEELLANTYSDLAEKVGLESSLDTVREIISENVPDEVMDCEFDALPRTWIFNPSKGWRMADQQDTLKSQDETPPPRMR